jgi:DNA-directed RNA polymerase beta subunit
VLAHNAGTSLGRRDRDRIKSQGRPKDTYELQKFMRPIGTLIHYKPTVKTGHDVRVATRWPTASTDHGDGARQEPGMVAFMSWEGYNFEDAIGPRGGQGRRAHSIHIEEYEIDAWHDRSATITRDIPNRPRSRCATSTTAASSASAPRRPGDPGRRHAEGETELTPRRS